MEKCRIVFSNQNPGQSPNRFLLDFSQAQAGKCRRKSREGSLVYDHGSTHLQLFPPHFPQPSSDHTPSTASQRKEEHHTWTSQLLCANIQSPLASVFLLILCFDTHVGLAPVKTTRALDSTPSQLFKNFNFFFFSFLVIPRHMEFQGQGSDLSHSGDLSQNCNAGSLVHCASQGIEPASQHSQDTPIPLHLSRSSKNYTFLYSLSLLKSTLQVNPSLWLFKLNFLLS